VIIERAKVLGFCAGVSRAVKMAQKNPGSYVVGGDLVHNPCEADRLKFDCNITSAENPDSIPAGSSAIIRAHGISKKIEDDLINRRVSVNDATCPKVKYVHNVMQSLADEGYSLFMLGEENHPEVLGAVGRVDTEVTVFSSADELKSIEIPNRAALVSQTTKGLEEFEKAGKFISERAREFKSVCTICPAMRNSQESVTELSKKCDIMIIIGGAKSSNTRTLLDTARMFCKDCYSVETPDQLNAEWFAGKKHCGIAAGLSTPSYSIDAVEAAISRLPQIASFFGRDVHFVA
jgi:4-hydroxy-3-methylbut-2-enyl diphosphate reductase